MAVRNNSENVDKSEVCGIYVFLENVCLLFSDSANLRQTHYSYVITLTLHSISLPLHQIPLKKKKRTETI